VTEDQASAPPDLEVRAGWRAGSARWHAHARTRSEAIGDVVTETLTEKQGLPEVPRRGRTYRNVARRWRFSAWTREPRR
jgi:hypothetical protein